MIPHIRTQFNTVFPHSLLLGHNTAISGNDQRLGAQASPDFYKFFMSIPKTIGTFFAHRYADCQMFVKALRSVVIADSQREIDRRINKIFQFKTVLETDATDRQAVCNRFSRLSSDTRDLFFYVNNRYLEEFRVATDPAKIETIRTEILRECERAICLQRTLTVVHVFINAYAGGGSRSSSSYTYNSGGGATTYTTTERPGQTNTAATTTASGIDVNVPLSVAYDKDAIPAAIQQKANEITRLKGFYDGLAAQPLMPDYFSDFMDIMPIPVFDASHPVIQSNLAALRNPGATPAIHNGNRALRHTMDAASLEGHMSSGHSWAPPKCPTCRHPEHGGIRRENLRIDTGLQDEMLQFFITNIPAHIRGG